MTRHVTGAAAVRRTVVRSAPRLRVHVCSGDDRLRERITAMLCRSGLAVVDEPGPDPGTVVLAAAGCVDDAIAACSPQALSTTSRLLLVADSFPAASVRKALRLGVRAMLRLTGTTAAQLSSAVHAAHHGEGMMPYAVLADVLKTAHPPVSPAPSRLRPVDRSPLTARQRSVLMLIAEGHGNASIAGLLCCSEHTVKNAIYELMNRLEVHNRAQAVACAVRAGLI